MFACDKCDFVDRNKSSLLRHLYSHHRAAMAELASLFWHKQKPTEMVSRVQCNGCRQTIRQKNWPEHVSSRHRGIYTVCPMAQNVPCGSEARPVVDEVDWEVEKGKLEDQAWWVEKGKDGE